MKRFLVLIALVSLVSAGHAQFATAFLNLHTVLLPDTSIEPVYNFTVTVKDNYKASLRWKVNGNSNDESFFTIEKSFNNLDFVVAGVLKKSPGEWTEFLDESPAQGKVYYRIKQTSGNLTPVYSQTIAVSLSGEAFCKFYPNPVDKVLIVRSELPVDIQIADRFGKQLLASHQDAGLKLVDVSTLEPGIYIITLFQKDANRIITEKLIKK